MNVIGMPKMTPPIKDLLPRLTPILKNRHEKVQENCIDLVGRIADRGAEFVPAREWMRICFELLEMLKAHKKGIRWGHLRTSPPPLQLHLAPVRLTCLGLAAVCPPSPPRSEEAVASPPLLPASFRQQVCSELVLPAHITSVLVLSQCRPPETDCALSLFLLLPGCRQKPDFHSHNWTASVLTVAGGCGCRRATVNTFGYIAKAIGPQDVLVTLLNNLKVQERQNRVCTTVAIAIVAETCAPFTVLPALMNEYKVRAP